MTRVASRRQALLAVIGGPTFAQSTGSGLRMAIPLLVLREGGVLGLSGEVSAGFLMGLFGLLPIVASMPAGRWIDRTGFHRPMQAMVGLAVAGALLAVPGALLGGVGAQAGGVAGWLIEAVRALSLMLGIVLVGCSINLGTICVQRTAARLATQADDLDGAHVPDSPARAAARASELKRAFSWLGVAPSVSNVVGPMLAGLCIDVLGFAAAFLVLGVLPFITLWTTRLVPRERITPTPAGRPRSKGLAGVRELLALPHMVRLLLITWLVVGSWDMLMFLVPVQGHALALSASAIGVVLAAFSLAVALVRLALPIVADRVAEWQVITGALVVMGLSFAMFPFATTAVLMSVVAVAAGLGLGLVQPMVLSTLYAITPADRQGEAMGLRTACIGLSSSVLPLCFGALGATVGSAVLFRGMAVLLLAGARLPTAFRRRPVDAR